MIEVYSDMRNFHIDTTFPDLSLNDFNKLSDPFVIFIGLPKADYEAMTNGTEEWNTVRWTTDQGRAELCAFGVFGKDEGVVISWIIDKKYVIGVDCYFSYFRINVSQAIKDGKFSPIIISHEPTILLDEFVREETEERFK